MSGETPWGITFFFEVSSAAPDDEPVWVDLSARVLDVGMPLETWEGRQTELEDVEPGRFQIQLRNRDDALTPGNPTSPYYPWWKQKRRYRVREVVAYTGFTHAEGYVEIPEVAVRTQEELDSDSDVTLFVSGVDILARLRDSRKFSAALVEHILYHGGADLKAFWPLTDQRPPYLGIGPIRTPITVNREVSGTGSPHEDAQPQTGLAPAGMESNGIRCEMSTNNGGVAHAWVRLTAPENLSIPVGAAESLTLVAWYSFGGTLMLSNEIIIIGVDNACVLYVHRDTTTGIWSLEAAGSMAGTVALGAVGQNQLLPIAVRLNPAAATAQLWVGGQMASVSLSGSPAGAMALTSVSWGFQVAYDLCAWQIYTGTTWGRTQFLTQAQQGGAPLDQQFTGQRINTILDYAGFAQGLRDVDPGVSVMQPVTMAGKNTQTLLDEANDTERGRLFAHAGRVKFHDRRRIYDV